MAEDTRSDTVEKFLSDEKAIEDRKQALIADLLKQREAAMKEFDQKLAKLGYQANRPGRPKRSHHGKAARADAGAGKPKAKA